MTMVMSLIVLPARAHDAPALTIKKGSDTVSSSLTVDKSESPLTLSADVTNPAAETTYTYAWTSEIKDVISIAENAGSSPTVSLNLLKAGSSKITCTATPRAAQGGSSGSAALNASVTITVNDSAGLKAAISSITFIGRSVSLSGGKLYYFSGEDLSTAKNWNVTPVAGSCYDITNKAYSNSKLTVTATKDSATVTAVYDVPSEEAKVTVTAKPATVTKTTGIATVTASAPTISGVTPAYTWTGVTATGNTATLTGVTTSTQVTCKASYTFESNTKEISANATITPDEKTYEWTGLPIGTLNMAKGDTDSTTLSPIKLVNSANKSEFASGVKYTYSSSNTNAVTVSNQGVITAVGNGPAVITITAKDSATDAPYRGNQLYKTAVTVSSTALEYSLGSVTNGSGAHPYSYDTLRSYAASVINTRLGNGSNLGYNDVTSLTVKSGSLATLGGSFAPAIGPLTSAGLTYTAPNASIGKASITLTAATARGNFDIAYNISVTPISWTFETVTAEPIVSNSAYYNNTYKVTFPTTTFNQFYVVNKTGVAPADYSSYNLITGTTSTTLNATDFNSSTGTCTLFVIAWNSNYSYNWSTGYSGKYYCGPITVTQTNHDIKYNGVVGGTVQFKHNDFTTFMNEMYGTNTTSYLTFNSVKFTSVPNATTQGTLYYNGVAMTTGYGSNYFNTSTAVTNLDNVSFSVSSKVPSTTKEIRIPFTLYATRYNSYGTSAGTSVTYSGVVVISLVREDVTFTVAPGDSVRFTDSAFLTYLRSASGINYNYNIDYVTFDQSAVNALNEGVLYAYSTGFNAVKTTDRFYYTTTSYNQNALSDVTFRASTYAKTGTTVYIPFTIYARYGTTGAATRQVTGTVAVKIAQTMNFVDVKTSDYFYDSVKWAVNNNITKGTSATTFSPNNTCTRAEIVTFLWRAAGSPTPTITRNPFTDVKYSVGSDFYNAILWASQNGIAAGTSTTTFAPNDNCTRAQIVTFLWRYAKKPLGYYTNPFNDVNKTEYAAYYDAILWAAGKGIATGNTPKTFNPDGTCTRAEAVTFLYRYESTK